MDDRKLITDFPSQKEYLEGMSQEGIKDFIFGGLCYDTETEEGKRVFTLRAARKYNEQQLFAVMHYLIISDKVDILKKSKDSISFNNILKAIEELTPPPTPEEKAETPRSLEEFKRKHAALFGEREK